VIPRRAQARLLAWATVLGGVIVVCSPWLADVTTLGFHDWDVMTSHRYLVKLSLLRYHELPGWNPYACGGFPAWSYIEGATTLVSPWLLPYLTLPIALALRVEVIGMALVGVLGAYALAGQFTRSPPARALVVALWGFDSRWSLQAAVGHAWHLAYAITPWCFYFFERARRERSDAGASFGPRFGLAASLAMLVYSGGIYPLSHTVLALALYAGVVAASERSVRPLGLLAGCGVLGVGLSAPKLVPMLRLFRRTPRLVDSSETLDLHLLGELLTSGDRHYRSDHGNLRLGWHEYGMYVSVAGLALLLLLLLVGGRREGALKLVGAVLVVLGLGAFHPEAPWTLLHAHVPFFRSQHVPSRFLYPALLLLSVAAAAALGRWAQRRRWREVAAGAAVLAIGLDVALVARQPMTQAMWMVPPPIAASDEFHFEQEPPFQYVRPDWAGPMYLAMLGNRGVVNCYGTPPFEGQRARAVADPLYQGEAYVEAPTGRSTIATARVTEWSPNHARIALDGADAGSTVVYNMNYDEGWRSDAGPVVSVDDKVAVRLDAPRSAVTFRYRPRGLELGLVLGALSVVATALLSHRARRARLVG
jgi:hypothetical protein